MTDAPQPQRRRHRPPPVSFRLARMFGMLAVIIASFLIGGFFIFVSTIPRAEPSRVSGDAIVALTGGPERLNDAFDLLDRGRAKYLLISGVNPGTREQQIARLHPQAARWLDCCVELGHRALNTAGNALETRQWVRKHGFQTVIVVTSGWHMRRSLLELQRSIPEVIFIPYPVITGSAESDSWWREPNNLRLLVAEYVKYLAALIEVRIAPRITDEEPPAAKKTST